MGLRHRRRLHVVPALPGAFARAAADGHGDLDMAATYLSVPVGKRARRE